MTHLVPTKYDIERLEVGDTVLSIYDEEVEVTRITARGTDSNGKSFVCYFHQHGPNAEMSSSMKEGEPILIFFPKEKGTK